MGPDDRIGETIATRYRIERRLGSGGMGVVYAAEELGTGRRVAIKLLRTGHVEPTLLARFRREAKLASRIAHPNIVQVLEIGSEGGTDFIAMELIDGKDLGAILAGGRLAVDRAIALTCQLLAALQVVHDAGIVHRDIKPSNVLLAPGDVVKLMDFGIARGLEDSTLTGTGNVVGTTEFMAPEQLRGGAIDHRADLYAIGITLYAMLTGDVPFRGATAAVAGAQVFLPPPSLAKRRPDTPPHVVAAVARALAKAPGERFADARAFGAALVAPREVATVAGRRRSRARTGWIVVAIAALAGGAIALAVRPASPPAPEVAAIAPADAAVARADAPPVVAPAPAPVDAGVADAAAPRVAPRTGSGGATDRRPARCFCVPTDAADVLPLCEARGPALCRCDDGPHSLCEQPLKITCYEETEWDGHHNVAKPNGNPCFTQSGECRYDASAFHRAGELDASCTGYPTPWTGKTDPVQVVGHVDCDVCSGARLDTYLGAAGDPCTGFYWRSGEVRHGKLDFCH